MLLYYSVCFAGLFVIVTQGKQWGNCCMPNKFLATETNMRTGVVSTMLIDFTSNRMKTTIKKAGHPIKNIIHDYNNGFSYVRYNNGVCKKVTTGPSAKYERCLPADARKIHDGYMGPDHSVDTITYRYQRADQTTIELSVIQGPYNCFPVVRRVLPKNEPVRVQMYANARVVQTNTNQYLVTDVSRCR